MAGLVVNATLGAGDPSIPLLSDDTNASATQDLNPHVVQIPQPREASTEEKTNDYVIRAVKGGLKILGGALIGTSFTMFYFDINSLGKLVFPVVGALLLCARIKKQPPSSSQDSDTESD